MKIGIHNEPAGGAIGGSEVCVGVLAEALSQNHQVDILHHRPTLSKDDLAKLSGVDLGRAGVRYVEPKRRDGNAVLRLLQNHFWYLNLSKPYDVFVSFTHNPPQFCHAPRGFLVILFPFEYRGQRQGGNVLKRLKQEYDEQRWSRRFKGYQIQTAISEFSSAWTQRRWKLDCQIFYPPVDVKYEAGTKGKLILSVGRFSASGVSKQQKEMVDAFSQTALAGNVPGWTYACVGGLSEEPSDRRYFEAAQEAAQGAPVDLMPNIDRASLKTLYEQAAIFWHAAGLSEDAETSPHLMEHFGITTVEAMGAGCVPVVIKKGAQPEIVQHGINGFVWETLEELKKYTQILTEDEALRVRMSHAARERAQYFSRQQFVNRFHSLLDGNK